MSWLALFYCICTHTHVQIVCGVYENEKWHHIGVCTDRLGVRKFGFGLGLNQPDRVSNNRVWKINSNSIQTCNPIRI